MTRIIVHGAPRQPAGVPALAIMAGLAVGLLAGFVAGAVAGPETARAISRGLRPGPAEPSLRAMVATAQAALDDDLMLRDYRLEVVPAGRGRIELHGWVADRRSRARAAHLVGDAVRAEAIINCLLVRGEDEPQVRPDESDADELLA